MPQQPSQVDVTSDDEEDGFYPGVNTCGVLTALNCARFLSGVEEHHKIPRSNRRGQARVAGLADLTWLASHMARPLTPMVMEQARGAGLWCALQSAEKFGSITHSSAEAMLRKLYRKPR